MMPNNPTITVIKPMMKKMMLLIFPMDNMLLEVPFELLPTKSESIQNTMPMMMNAILMTIREYVCMLKIYHYLTKIKSTRFDHIMKKRYFLYKRDQPKIIFLRHCHERRKAEFFC